MVWFRCVWFVIYFINCCRNYNVYLVKDDDGWKCKLKFLNGYDVLGYVDYDCGFCN